MEEFKPIIYRKLEPFPIIYIIDRNDLFSDFDYIEEQVKLYIKASCLLFWNKKFDLLKLN